jgi:hypothetical protein
LLILEKDATVGLVSCATTKEELHIYTDKKIGNKVVYVNFDFRKINNSNGWYMMGRTGDWKQIPSGLDIFYGDDFIHYNVWESGKRVVKIMSNYISHDVSTTVNSLNIYSSNILLDEGETYKKYFENIGDENMVKYMENFLSLILRK